MDYRDDDLTDRGYCPICGKETRDVNVDGSGWCSEHGKVWLNWTPPKPDEEEDGDV